MAKEKKDGDFFKEKQSSVHINLSLIVPSKSNPRKKFDATKIEELANDIRLHGLLQPIVVREILPGEDDDVHTYEIIAGERRYQACQRLYVENTLDSEWQQIECMVKDCTPGEAAEMRLSENLKREHLNAIEIALGLQTILDETPGLTQEGVGKRMGMSQGNVANYVRLLQLPQPAQDCIADGLTASHGVALLSLLANAKSDEERAGAVVVIEGLAKIALQKSLPVATLEEDVKEAINKMVQRRGQGNLALDVPNDDAENGVEKSGTDNLATNTPPVTSAPPPTAKTTTDTKPRETDTDSDSDAGMDDAGSTLKETETPPTSSDKPEVTQGTDGAERIATSILQSDNDYLWQIGLTLDEFFEQLREITQRPQLTPLAHKCLKALNDEAVAQGEGASSLSEFLEAILVERAYALEIDVNTLKENPE
jgi:ParB family transcriptional regulator, chromosome partitioning protein